jgi:2,3-dihydro-2,3-dihydroxybenzoate dehydrogenase
VGGVALVTGAARGIGAAVARTLAARGAAVAVVDREGAQAAVVADGLNADGYRALAVAADVTDAAAVEDAVTRAEAALGPITTLANVAGVLRHGPLLEMSDDDWAQCLAVNATGVLHASRAAAARMVERGGGSVVTVASNAAGVPRTGMAAYAASKAAAVALTRCLGLELGPRGVRANVVCPGSTDTDMLRELDVDHAALVAGTPEAFRVGIPLGRVGAADDVAEAVAFLASDAARHVTLQTLYVDGGASLGP